jgi:Ca-activated chloride channel homolog
MPKRIEKSVSLQKENLMRFIFSLLSLILFFVFSPETFAQNAKPKKTLVSVPVTVSDRDGLYIPNLKKDDFTIFQDGVKQEIVSFATEDEPVSIVLLLDTSRSTERVLGEIKKAARDFIKQLNPQDKAMIATFDSKVSILNQFTNNQDKLLEAIDNVRIDEKVGTVLRRAVSQITQNSFTPIEGRKALIVLTDGKDFGSYITKNELLEQLQESDVMVYSIFFKTGMDLKRLGINPDGTFQPVSALVKPQQPKKKKKGYALVIPDEDAPSDEEIIIRERKDDAEAMDALKKMSDTTAGRFYLRDVTDLGSAFKQISDELRKQYRLSYYSNTAEVNPVVHDIVVKVSRPDVVVRSRLSVRDKLEKNQ